MPKIPTRINSIIEEFSTKVEELLRNRIKKIILYGSYARRRF